MTGPDPEKRESEHSESDVDDDPKVAGSRADGEEGGSYVGRTFSDEDFDSGQTGAEARSEAD
ncbi:hypothetical protein [Mycolicibacterium bacteremicum]|uniref:Uncharacterized protein n=1 Tax=Mycolicibacterium bacteremicum TaxID=564198 RepID=A0A1W9YTR4_MYCBA|nr:hypothetical protein [Mycolicibacterium bacteremicum]MCV7432980.1 hypothetical protein [Mycolicibacterium bacteremicum]ORA03312.1 hypothetical protein BST17_19605 [Mycolicibacterium bacteremicum]